MDIDWKKDFIPHPSHNMTRYRSTIRTPSSTPRFYSVSNCKNCELETGKSVAGEYYEIYLKYKCRELYD